MGVLWEVSSSEVTVKLWLGYGGVFSEVVRKLVWNFLFTSGLIIVSVVEHSSPF